MTYAEYRANIQGALRKRPEGMTWKELKSELQLPYSQPCYEWMARLEKDIGLVRKEKRGNTLLWQV